VIGHGINVPATTVLFAETTKFDGIERRPLRTWETAQIAGRAGRYGLTGHGAVGVLAGVTGLKADAGLLVAGAEVARGDAMSDLPKRAPRLRPELDDLGAFEPVADPGATPTSAKATAATSGPLLPPCAPPRKADGAAASPAPAARPAGDPRADGPAARAESSLHGRVGATRP
jgi:hypothetical protein